MLNATRPIQQRTLHKFAYNPRDQASATQAREWLASFLNQNPDTEALVYGDSSQITIEVKGPAVGTRPDYPQAFFQ